MNIAFWNVNKKDLSDILVELVIEFDIDILVLAEIEEDIILKYIGKQNGFNKNRQYKIINSAKITLISSYDLSVFSKIENSISPRWSSFVIQLPTIVKFNLFAVHFHSKLNWSDNSLALECVNLARDIDTIESRTGLGDSIVIGDFNMNPYESGIIAANGLHALPDLHHISKRPKGRQIDGITYKYFYNPMWNYFGDNIQPFGTYYYREPGHVSREWNIFDQIIYRPSMAQYIQRGSIKIIDKINSLNLVDALNRPDRGAFSDHLPILVTLTI